jgi:hypothetical protein
LKECSPCADECRAMCVCFLSSLFFFSFWWQKMFLTACVHIRVDIKMWIFFSFEFSFCFILEEVIKLIICCVSETHCARLIWRREKKLEVSANFPSTLYSSPNRRGGRCSLMMWFPAMKGKCASNGTKFQSYGKSCWEYVDEARINCEINWYCQAEELHEVCLVSKL